MSLLSLTLTLASFILSIKADDPLGSIYLILIALPWSMIVSFIIDQSGANIITLNYALMLVGIGLNVILMVMFSRWLYRRSARRDLK